MCWSLVKAPAQRENLVRLHAGHSHKGTTEMKIAV
jgi:hypothetical protein